MSFQEQYMEMQNFFDSLVDDYKNNPNRIIDYKYIYSKLLYKMNKKIKKYETKELLNNIDISLVNSKRISSEEYSLKCCSNNYCFNRYDISVFLSIDDENFKDDISKMISFLDEQDYTYMFYVAKTINNECINIRFSKLNELLDFIDYINMDDLKNGLIYGNPFMPKYKDISMITDNGFSYNKVLSKLIYEYFDTIIVKNNKPTFSVLFFNKFVNDKIVQEDNIDLKQIYQVISRTTTQDPSIQCVITNYYENKERQFGKKVINISDKNKILLTASLKMINKYGVKALCSALKANNGIFKGFSKTNDDRALICANLDSDSLRTIMINYLNINNITTTSKITNNDLFELYSYVIYHKMDKRNHINTR